MSNQLVFTAIHQMQLKEQRGASTNSLVNVFLRERKVTGIQTDKQHVPKVEEAAQAAPENEERKAAEAAAQFCQKLTT